MFKNILVPISSEFYNKKVLKRAVFLAEKFKSKINLIYIIETKTIDQADKISDTYLSNFKINETNKQMMKGQVKTADKIVFEDAKTYFKGKKIIFEEKIFRGEFSEVIKSELEKGSFDLVLMGFEKECLLNYRLLEDANIPVWIEGKSDSRTILSVLSNLAPNQKVPDISVKLSKKLNWDLKMIYIIDTEDNVLVDEKGVRSEKKPERDLVFAGQNFVEDFQKKKISAELVKGNLEKQIAKKAEEINANLVIIGREQKKKGPLGFPAKNIKKKMAEKCKHSILFIN